MKRFSKTTIGLAVMLSFWATGRVVFGQTNTFPDTGKAGIGTTSPFLPLHIQGTQGGALLPLLLLRNSSGIPSSAVSLDFTNFAARGLPMKLALEFKRSERALTPNMRWYSAPRERVGH